jgi:integrase
VAPALLSASTTACLRAALSNAANEDERIGNRRAWEKALASLPNATQAPNVILSEAAVRAIVAAAYDVSRKFGVLAELLAVTGCRVTQAARLEVADVQADRADPSSPP